MGRMGICFRRRHRSMEVAVKSNYPMEGGITPTAGGVVFFGDLGGNFYALDVANGKKLWGQKIGGAIAGGVITYMAGGAQRVAVATGLAKLWVRLGSACPSNPRSYLHERAGHRLSPRT